MFKVNGLLLSSRIQAAAQTYFSIARVAYPVALIGAGAYYWLALLIYCRFNLDAFVRFSLSEPLFVYFDLFITPAVVFIILSIFSSAQMADVIFHARTLPSKLVTAAFVSVTIVSPMILAGGLVTEEYSPPHNPIYFGDRFTPSDPQSSGVVDLCLRASLMQTPQMTARLVSGLRLDCGYTNNAIESAVGNGGAGHKIVSAAVAQTIYNKFLEAKFGVSAEGAPLRDSIVVPPARVGNFVFTFITLCQLFPFDSNIWSNGS